MITVCLLILVCWFLGKPVGHLLSKLGDVDWKRMSRNAWNKIVKYSKNAGRTATRMALYFYYVMTESELTTCEKALVCGGIIYVMVPNDLLPRKVLGLLGVADDAAIAAFVYNKIKDHLTPDIEAKVGETLDHWFGYEITSGVTE